MAQTFRLASRLFLLAMIGTTHSALAQPLSAAERDAPPSLEPGFWLRAELGFADVHTTLEAPGAGETSSHAYSPAAALRVGYAPAEWVAVGGALDFTLTRFRQESAGVEQRFDATYGLAGLGAQFYPFRELGLNFGAVGGYSLLALDDGNDSRALWGPGFALSIGLDGRIFTGRTWVGDPVKIEAARSQLFGVALRFDYTPKLTGDELEARVWSLGFLITSSI
jgi:hypothetical protein